MSDSIKDAVYYTRILENFVITQNDYCRKICAHFWNKYGAKIHEQLVDNANMGCHNIEFEIDIDEFERKYNDPRLLKMIETELEEKGFTKVMFVNNYLFITFDKNQESTA